MSDSTELPKKYKACIYDSPGKISTKVVEMDIPEPGAAEVLVKLTHSGVCHSDLGVMTNTWSILPYPTQEGQIGGHEGVGTVVKLGPGAETSNVKIGDRVGIKWMSGVCGSCPACLSGHDGVCFNGKISGYYTPGTFAEYACGPANYVTPIPEGLDSAAAAPLMCGGVTVYAALRKSNALSGHYVAIMGAGGGLGHLAVQIAARGMGYRVIGIDHSSKKDLVMESGAEHFFAHDQEKDMTAAIQGVTDKLGAHAVIVVTAANGAYAQAVDLLRFGGRVVCVGIPENDPVAIAKAFPGLLVAKELSIVGSAVGHRRDAIETLELAARGVVKMHYREEKLENLTSVFEDMHKGIIQGRVVLNMA